MEEIRKQRKVRGIAGALRGCARPEGWSFGDASFRGYAIDFQHAISFVARAQTANSWRNDLDGGGLRPRSRCGFAPDNMDSTSVSATARHP